MRRYILLAITFFYLTTTASATYCVADGDCNSTQYCNASSALCVDKGVVGAGCTRDAACLASYCDVGGTDQCTASTFTYDEYHNYPDSTDFEAEADKSDIANSTLDNDYGRIVWYATLDLTYGMDFDTACEFGEYFIECDSDYAPQLDDVANLTIKNTPYDEYLLDHVTILKDGVVCSDCGNKVRANSDISFTVTGFSNYSITLSSNYSALIEGYTCPAELYLPGPTGSARESCITFTLKNTNGELLENQDADVYVTDTASGVVVKKFNTLATSGEYYEDQNGNLVSISDGDHPLTNARGQYTYCFTTGDWANYGDNLTIHAVANGQEGNCTVLVDVAQRADVEGWFTYLRKYSGLVVLGSMFLLILWYLIARTSSAVQGRLHS